MIHQIKKIYLLQISFFFLLAISFVACSKKEKDPKIVEIEEKIQKISVESKLPIEAIEKIGIELDEHYRRCGREFAKEKKSIREKKTIECRKKSEEELFKKNNLPMTSLSDMIQAHILLQWELKHFSKNLSVAKMKKIYSDGMAGMFSCMKMEGQPSESKENLDRKIEECSEEKFFKICEDHQVNQSDCGKIISMGTDYGWDIESEKKTQILNPQAPENK